MPAGSSTASRIATQPTERLLRRRRRERPVGLFCFSIINCSSMATVCEPSSLLRNSDGSERFGISRIAHYTSYRTGCQETGRRPCLLRPARSIRGEFRASVMFRGTVLNACPSAAFGSVHFFAGEDAPLCGVQAAEVGSALWELSMDAVPAGRNIFTIGA